MFYFMALSVSMINTGIFNGTANIYDYTVLLNGNVSDYDYRVLFIGTPRNYDYTVLMTLPVTITTL